MKPPIKLLLGIAAAVSVTGLAFFGWSVKAKDEATIQFANGVQVTPVEVKPDDTAMALDAYIWKFDVHLPYPHKIYNYSLFLCQHGKVVSPLGGVGTGSIKPSDGIAVTQVTIGMVPIDDTFGKAKRIKYALRVGGAGTLGTFTNPFKDNGGYGSNVQANSSDNMVYLISGSKYGGSSIASENDENIGLQIETSQSTL